MHSLPKKFFYGIMKKDFLYKEKRMAIVSSNLRKLIQEWTSRDKINQKKLREEIIDIISEEDIDGNPETIETVKRNKKHIGYIEKNGLSWKFRLENKIRLKFTLMKKKDSRSGKASYSFSLKEEDLSESTNI